jgi:hypothetical protein
MLFPDRSSLFIDTKEFNLNVAEGDIHALNRNFEHILEWIKLRVYENGIDLTDYDYELEELCDLGWQAYERFFGYNARKHIRRKIETQEQEGEGLSLLFKAPLDNRLPNWEVFYGGDWNEYDPRKFWGFRNVSSIMRQL